VAGYLEVLDAERNLFGVEQALLQLRRAQADNLVSLLHRARRRLDGVGDKRPRPR